MTEPFTVGDDWLDRDALPYPDWTTVAGRIAACPADAQADCWAAAAREWLTAFAVVLGPDFGVHETELVQVLGPTADGHAAWLARCVERSRRRLLDQLPGVADFTQPGKLVLIHLPDADWYYAHVGRFYPKAGEFGGSAGMHLRDGHPHVALTGRFPPELEATVAHELTHVGLQHLDAPLWLEEGLAQLAGLGVRGPGAGGLDERAVRWHHRYWPRNGLGTFWWGEGFGAAGRVQNLCYQLALALTNILIEDHRPGWFGGRARQRRLVGFVRAARAADAGQAAAVEHLGCGLGEVAARFLGPGDWHPGEPPPARRPPEEATGRRVD